MLPLLYARNHTPGSALIRAAQWWAPWSHVGVLDEERAQVIEARRSAWITSTCRDHRQLHALTLAMALPTVNATHVHVVNLDTEEVYYTKGSGTVLPASLTKLLTVYVVRQSKPTSGDLDEQVTIQASDLTAGFFHGS